VRELEQERQLDREAKEVAWIYHPVLKQDEIQEAPEDVVPDERLSTPEIQADLTLPGPPILLLRGGTGGKGNAFFQRPDNKIPKVATSGREGETAMLELELKLLADIGLVGFPNAGKSTLLRAISNSKTKVGNWAFTTLNPWIGTISYGVEAKQFTVADIPGLIAGSSEDKGMGLEFLRHVERARGLAFVLDLSRPKPWQDLEVLHQELDFYGHDIQDKQSIIIANKADTEHARSQFLELQKRGVNAIPISALRSEGMDTVVDAMANIVF